MGVVVHQATTRDVADVPEQDAQAEPEPAPKRVPARPAVPPSPPAAKAGGDTS